MGTLYIYTADVGLRNAYRESIVGRRSTDSGLDIFMPKSDTVRWRNTQRLGLGVVVAAKTHLGVPAPCLLLPRSSMSKTPLRMANSIGLIDAGYRGEVAAAVDNIDSKNYDVTYGDRLFQICQHDFLPWTKIVIVDRLEDLPAAPDDRGAGGFGSTGA